MKQLFFLPLLLLIILSSCKKETAQAEKLTQEQERELLEKRHEEIIKISESVSCVNSNGWLYTAIGSKACGGPTGYIAYSKHIDTIAFLHKVEAFTTAQNNYNIKWEMISDCSLPPNPKGVNCKNGVAVLVY